MTGYSLLLHEAREAKHDAVSAVITWQSCCRHWAGPSHLATFEDGSSTALYHYQEAHNMPILHCESLCCFKTLKHDLNLALST